MAGRQSAATEYALKAYREGASVYGLAKSYRISPSTLYRAIARRAKARKRKAQP